MRDIKFRGKNIHTNLWEYGSGLRIYGNGDIFMESTYDYYKEHHKLDPETACQFTGLRDKNGVEIYEGNIVKIFDYIIGEVTFEKGTFGVGFIKDIDYELLEEYLSSYKGYNDDWYGCNNSNFISFYEIYSNCNDLDCIEVIGNIYDNPELLKGE